MHVTINQLLQEQFNVFDREHAHHLQIIPPTDMLSQQDVVVYI